MSSSALLFVLFFDCFLLLKDVISSASSSIVVGGTSVSKSLYFFVFGFFLFPRYEDWKCFVPRSLVFPLMSSSTPDVSKLTSSKKLPSSFLSRLIPIAASELFVDL